jgi:restriction endonuclease Mrr
MRPQLALLAYGKVHPLPDLLKKLISEFQLTEEEVKVRLPSGRQAAVSNRIGWVGAYLGKGGLLRKSIKSEPNGTNLRSVCTVLSTAYTNNVAGYGLSGFVLKGLKLVPFKSDPIDSIDSTLK